MSVPDRLPVRVVVLALAVGFIGSIVAITFLAATQTPIPDALSDIPVFTGGALGAMLAKTQPTQDSPLDGTVTIDQPESAPIPVTPVGPVGGDQP